MLLRTEEQKMKSASKTHIDPTITSFKLMKCLVDSTLGKEIPSSAELIEGQAKPLFSFDKGDTTVTVFMSGFCLCQSIDGDKVFAIDRCRSISLRTSNNEIVSIEEQRFSAGPCLIPLLVIGCASQRFAAEDFTDLWQQFSERCYAP